MSVTRSDLDPTSDLEQQLIPSPKPLRYLADFKPHEMKELRNQYLLKKGDNEEAYKRAQKAKVSEAEAQELDQLIANHSKTYYYHASTLYGSQVLEFTFYVTNIGLAQTGIQAVIPAMPYAPAFVIGGLMATVNLTFDVNTFEARKEAKKLTLKSATSPSYCVQFKDFCRKPARYIITDTIQVIFDGTIILNHNVNGGVLDLISVYTPLPLPFTSAEIPALMPMAPLWAQIPLDLLVLGLTNKYYNIYKTPSYHQNLKFWHDFEGFKFWQSKNPWLLGEVARGNIAVPFQVFLQGTVSAVGTRSFPNFYYGAQAAGEIAESMLGMPWVPPWLVAAGVVIHSERTLYPATYNKYYENKTKLKDLFQKFQALWDEKYAALHSQAENENLDPAALYALVREFDQLAHKLKLITEEKNNVAALTRTEIFKNEKPAVAQIAIRTGIGGAFGYFGLSQLAIQYTFNTAISISMSIGGAVFSSILFGGMLYRAEKDRIQDQVLVSRVTDVVKGMEPTEEKSEIEIEEELLSNWKADLLADAINSTAQTLRAITTMGSLQRIIPDNYTLLVIIGLICLEQALNGTIFNAKNMREMVGNFRCFRPKPAIEDDSNIQELLSEATDLSESKSAENNSKSSSSSMLSRLWCCGNRKKSTAAPSALTSSTTSQTQSSSQSWFSGWRCWERGKPATAVNVTNHPGADVALPQANNGTAAMSQKM